MITCFRKFIFKKKLILNISEKTSLIILIEHSWRAEHNTAEQSIVQEIFRQNYFFGKTKDIKLFGHKRTFNGKLGVHLNDSYILSVTRSPLRKTLLVNLMVNRVSLNLVVLYCRCSSSGGGGGAGECHSMPQY